jgi:hypothetical protein
LGGGELGGLGDRAGRPGEGDGVKPAQLAGQGRPGLPGAPLGDPDQEQRQPAEQHVGADAWFARQGVDQFETGARRR